MVYFSVITQYDLVNRWTTNKINYTNVFSQADLKEDIYIEQPKEFTRNLKLDMILKLTRSLYGLSQAPKNILVQLRAGLEVLKNFKDRKW